MRIERVITMASAAVEIEFRAMERSLRATGCALPLWVIPYDDARPFDLPPNAHWWRDEPFLTWLSSRAAHPTMRKYQCLTSSAFHYADTDIIFLRDPTEVLAPHHGVVSACTEWNKPRWTVTPESAAMFMRASSTWQLNVVSSGQFACEAALYDLESLKATLVDPRHRSTCLDYPHHEQPGLNLLLHAAGAEVTNLTLPPTRMQSTWAGDYADEYATLWDGDDAPYLIHWAGRPADGSAPIDLVFRQFLARDELREWGALMDTREQRLQGRASWPLMVRLANRLLHRSRRFKIAFRDPLDP